MGNTITLDQAAQMSSFDFDRYRLNDDGNFIANGNWLARIVRWIFDAWKNASMRKALVLFAKTYKDFKVKANEIKSCGYSDRKIIKRIQSSWEWQRMRFLFQYLLRHETKFRKFVDTHPTFNSQMQEVLAKLDVERLHVAASEKTVHTFYRLLFVSPPTIHLKNLFRKPVAPQNMLGDDDKRQNIDSLKYLFNRLFPAKRSLSYHSLGIQLGRHARDKLYDNLEKMLKEVQNGVKGLAKQGLLHPSIPPKPFFTEIELYLKRINYKCAGISDDKKRKILYELAQAANDCAPTWLEVCFRVVSELYGYDDTVTGRTKRYVQQVKESIILGWSDTHLKQDPFFSKEWHHLDWMRKEFGQEFGLDNSRIKYDPYKQGIKALNRHECRKWFLEELTPEAVINGVKTCFDLAKRKEDQTDLPSYFMTRLSKMGFDDGPSMIKNELYDFTKKELTYKGCWFLLLDPEIGIF